MTRLRRPALVSWSGGKDSALALEAARRDPGLHVAGLITTVTAGYDRISMHGVRRELLLDQARAVGLPVTEVEIPPACPDAEYQRRMCAALEAAVREGIEVIVFGDLFLADVRAYREALVAEAGLEPAFPLWGRDTGAVAHDLIARGYRTTLVCVDPRQVPASLCGREYDASLLDALGPDADPCGERGEFHTFVHDAPIFTRPVRVEAGEIVERDGFVFCDLLPAFDSGPLASSV